MKNQGVNGRTALIWILKEIRAFESEMNSTAPAYEPVTACGEKSTKFSFFINSDILTSVSDYSLLINDSTLRNQYTV